MPCSAFLSTRPPASSAISGLGTQTPVHWLLHRLSNVQAKDDLEPISSALQLKPKCVCSAPGCKSTRIRRDCSRIRSKTHCMELGGGCISAAHKVNAPTSNLAHSNFQFPSLWPSTPHPFGVDPALTVALNLQPIASSSMPVTVAPNLQPMSTSFDSWPMTCVTDDCFFYTTMGY